MSDGPKSRVQGKQTTITFVYMHSGAKHMLALAEATQDGQLYTLVSSLVYSAFTLEAYLNHLGKLRHSNWDEIERGYPKLRKFQMFAKAGGLSPDFDVRPHSTLIALFAFRDGMAHGKTVTQKVSTLIDRDGPRLPALVGDTGWRTYATIRNARQAIQDVEVMVRELHTACGYPGDPFASAGGGIYVVTPE